MDLFLRLSALLPASFDDGLALALGAPASYAAWWARQLEENPSRIVLETSLILAVVLLAFMRPRGKRTEFKLTRREVDDLLHDWTPDPLVDDALLDGGSLAHTTAYTTATRPDLVLARKLGATVVTREGAELVDFCTFDFLGLTCDHDVKRACVEVLDHVGCGSCGPRGFYGTLDEHMELEDKIASFMGVPESIMYSDAASTAASVIPAFAKRSDMVFVDEACYDAILTGVMLSRCTAVYFKHNDMADLARKLDAVAARDKERGTSPATQRRFVVVEGIYRNTGDIVPLKEVVELKDKHHCRLILDESFSFGVLGDTGRGVTEHFGVPMKQVDIVCGALCASIGSVGGFCIGNEREVVNHQRLQGAGYVFSASAPPFVARAATVGIQKLADDPRLAQTVRDNALQLWAGLEACAHLEVTSAPQSPVLHFRARPGLVVSGATTGNERAVLEDVAERLQKEHGVFAVASKYMPHHLHKEAAKRRAAGGKELGPAEPGVSIRMCVSALHTSEQIQAAINAVLTSTEAVFVDAFGASAVKKKKKKKNTNNKASVAKSTKKKRSSRAATPKRK